MPKGIVNRPNGNPRNQLLTAKVTCSVKEAVDQEAARLGIPRSQFLAKALDEYLAQRK